MPEKVSVTLEQMNFAKLFESQLSIPSYQRMYTWESSHVRDLLKDLFGRTSSYLMGTIILHERIDKNGGAIFDIVDGQQRLVTMTILCRELEVKMISLPLLKGCFSDSSVKIIRNTQHIVREFLAVKNSDEKMTLKDFLEKSPNEQNVPCLLFSVLKIKGDHALDQAYTFFDSFNSKGKSLTDFDLLKAHHLMFIPSHQETLATLHNYEWQSRDENHAQLFGSILRRIRMWAKNLARDNKQERPNYNEFCSVVEPGRNFTGEHLFNRYMQPAAFRSWRREGERIILSMDYPVFDPEALLPAEVTQTIEGGDSFFIYAKRYHKLYETLFINADTNRSTGITFVSKMALHIDNAYLRDAFRAVMLLYFDKFGDERLIAIAVCVESILSDLRWTSARLRIEAMLTIVNQKLIIPVMLNAVNSSHVFAQMLSTAKMAKSAEQDITGVKLSYYRRMQQFYKEDKSKILDKSILAIAEKYDRLK